MTTILAAADPANAYGAALAWPRDESRHGRTPSRAAGAYVVLLDGELALYLERGGRSLLTFAPFDDDAVAALALAALGSAAPRRPAPPAPGRTHRRARRSSHRRTGRASRRWASGGRIAASSWDRAAGRPDRARAFGPMPEGDTLRRTADVLRPCAARRRGRGACGRPGGAQLTSGGGQSRRRGAKPGQAPAHRLRRRPDAAHASGHARLLAPLPAGERWRRRRDAAVAVLDTGTAVAVCFDAPVVELLETRAAAHPPSPVRARARPPRPDVGGDVSRVQRMPRACRGLLGQSVAARHASPRRSSTSRAVAGMGNVYRSARTSSSLGGLDPRRGGTRLTVPRPRRLDARPRTWLPARSCHWRRRPRSTTRPTWAPGDALACGREVTACGSTVGRSAMPALRHAHPLGGAGTPPRRLYWCPRARRRTADRSAQGRPEVPGSADQAQVRPRNARASRTVASRAAPSRRGERHQPASAAPTIVPSRRAAASSQVAPLEPARVRPEPGHGGPDEQQVVDAQRPREADDELELADRVRPRRERQDAEERDPDERPRAGSVAAG